MARRKLTDKEWDALDALRFSTSDVAVFRNATVILMSDVGRSKVDIAEELGCCPATVDNIRKRYREQGLAGLTPRKSTGRRSRATPEYRAAHLIRRADPADGSFQRRWPAWSLVIRRP